MRHFLYSVGLVLLLAGCDLETSDNGDLDGYWHLTRVDTLTTGGTLDTSEQLLFWAVQVRLLNVVDQSDDADHMGYLLRFEHKEGTLRVYEPYKNSRKDGDIKVDDASVLSPFGINLLDETFRVEQLDGDGMQLTGDALRLTFVRF
jgi:hypothetical protein